MGNVVEVSALPSGAGDLYELARVKLTTGKVVSSQRRDDIPPWGYVPG
jgi:hypothetical protein